MIKVYKDIKEDWKPKIKALRFWCFPVFSLVSVQIQISK